MKPGDKIIIERLDAGSHSIEANGVVFVGDASTAAVCLNKAVFGDEANASEQRLVERMAALEKAEAEAPAPTEPIC